MIKVDINILKDHTKELFISKEKIKYCKRKKIFARISILERSF